MSRRMVVSGRNFDVVGDVMGDVMGDDDDEYAAIVGAAKRAKKRRIMAALQQPEWREGQIAPGVQTPDEGVVPLQLVGSTGSNTFAAALQNITFVGTTQKPFRSERFLVSVVRTGTTATGRILGQLFVGTDLQQADVDGFDLEVVGNPAAFGVRLTMSPAQPGVAIKIPTRLTVTLTTTDTIQCYPQLLGRIVR